MSPHAGTDYRPVNYNPSVMLGFSAGLRIEGAGSVEMHSVVVHMSPPATGIPPYWLRECVEHATLPVGLDPHPQGFAVTGEPVRCEQPPRVEA